MDKKHVLALGLLPLLALAGYAAHEFFGPEPQTVVVTLTSDGFLPATTTIKRGDVVRFVGAAERRFWPASDGHPVHSIYPEFDPLRPLQPDEAWEFTFTSRGEWGYHDHLHSFAKGVIQVE